MTTAAQNVIGQSGLTNSIMDVHQTAGTIRSGVQGGSLTALGQTVWSDSAFSWVVAGYDEDAGRNAIKVGANPKVVVTGTPVVTDADDIYLGIGSNITTGGSALTGSIAEVLIFSGVDLLADAHAEDLALLQSYAQTVLGLAA